MYKSELLINNICDDAIVICLDIILLSPDY